MRIQYHFESPSEQSSTQADKQLPAATFRYKEACAATADWKVATAGARTIIIVSVQFDDLTSNQVAQCRRMRQSLATTLGR